MLPERANQVVLLKNMLSGEQKTVPRSEVGGAVKREIAAMDGQLDVGAGAG